MLSESERRIARLAVQQRYLTGTQLCVCVESRRSSELSLDKLFVRHGFLTDEEAGELRRLTEAETGPVPSFGEILREQGFASAEQILEASSVKDALATRNIHRRLGEILLEKRVITEEHVAQVLERQSSRRDAPPPPIQIREEIGRGPAGVVYRAYHETLGHEIALKVLDGGRAPGDTARRIAEVDHPNLARVLAAGAYHGSPCLLSEFVEGIPLYDHVVGSVRLPLEEAIPILKQIAAALGAAHARGFFHGNLKARNVLLTDSREVKVSDFGLAPAAGAPPSADLLLHLAPERLPGPPTPASDFYSCGVLWYFMLSGIQPFGAATATEIRRRHAEFRPAPLASRVPGLPPGADLVFNRLTAREPSFRYRESRLLLSDLDRLENDAPRS